MGTDIHGVFQRRIETGWEDIPSKYEQNRHYQLFAVLANVRNGYGFAGIQTGEPVRPIAEPRGLPPDFEMRDDLHPIASIELMGPRRRKYYPLEVWMGDHSHSWLSGEEMLRWTPPKVIKTGVLTRAQYDAWDKSSPPTSYSGDVLGSLIIKINDNAVEREGRPDWTHIRCSWTSDLREELSYFFDEVARLVGWHGEIRFVFGFDS